MAIRELAPAEGELAPEDVVERVVSAPSSEPFAELTVELLDAISVQIRQSKHRRTDPVFTSLAFWLREGNIRSIVDRHLGGLDPEAIPAPLGYVFHIAPGNIEPMFVYSWALSLLAGNRNIVRVSGDPPSLVRELLSILRVVLQTPRFEPLARRNVFVTYPRRRTVTHLFSEPASGRLIWGDDSTIAKLRQLPCATDARTMTFPHRRSATAIDSGALLAADDPELGEIADRFVTDAYLFDQRACASPQHVFFVGDDRTEEASSRFWGAVREQLRERGHRDSKGLATTKLRHLHELVADGLELARAPDLEARAPTVVRAADPGATDFGSCGGGFFLEALVGDVDELADWLRPNHQTLTHWGFDRAPLAELVRNLRGRSLQRVVPIGRALEFAPNWDGWEILTNLTRTIPVDHR